MLNSWLDPSQVGNFTNEATLEIRSSLSIQDTPPGIAGAVDPTPDDLVPDTTPYALSATDQVVIRVFELLQGETETALQVSVDEEGMITLPILGRVKIGGLTAREAEAEIADILRQRDILLDAQVIVEPVTRRTATYSVFGTVASPNVYAVLRPDFRLREALGVAGGLIETVTDLYVFRENSAKLRQFSRLSGQTRQPKSAGQPSLPSQNRAGPQPSVSPEVMALSGSLGAGGSGGRGPTKQLPPLESEPAAEPPRHAPHPTDASTIGVPTTDKQAASDVQELLRLVTGEAQVTTGTGGTRASGTAETGPAAIIHMPTPQPRFIFMNDQWIEVPPTTALAEPGQPERKATPIEPGPRERPGAPVLPEPVPEPAVDWSRLAGQEPEHRVIRISATGLRDGDPRQNIVIRPGDSIRVDSGEVGEYYVMGQVSRPGAYSLTGRRVTLKAAMAAAGNIAPLGWPDRCTVYRRYGDREEMKQVNLDAIFAGKQPDLFLKKDDVLLVGTHPVAPFLAVIRTAFRMTYGFGFVYDRNFADIDSYGAKVNPSLEQKRFPNLFQ